MSDWSTVNVTEWMATVNMYRYIEVFKRKQITGALLESLSEDRLKVQIILRASGVAPLLAGAESKLKQPQKQHVSMTT